MSRRASATVLGLLLVSLVTGLSSIAGALGTNSGRVSPPPTQQGGSNSGPVTPPTTPPTTPPVSGSNAGGGLGEQGEPPTPAPNPTPAPDPTPAPSPGAGGGNDLGPAVAAPATADVAPAPAESAAAGSAAAGPGAPPAGEAAAAADDPAAGVVPAPTGELILPDFVVDALDEGTPRTAAESLVARAPQSIAAVAALLLAVIVFLAFHRRPDRHDPRLAAANGVQDVARFR